VPAPGGWRGWAGCQLLESAWGCRHPWLAVPATGVGPSAASAMRGGSQFSCWSEWGSGPASTGAGTAPVLKTTYWGTSVSEGSVRVCIFPRPEVHGLCVCIFTSEW